MVDNNINEMQKYKEMRNGVYDSFYDDKDYVEAIKRCNIFAKTLIEENATEKMNYWAAYNTKAKSLLRLDKPEKALTYAKLSNWYAKNGSFERICNMDIMARCYGMLPEYGHLAIACFDKCYTLYKNLNNKRGMARSLNNKVEYMITVENLKAESIPMMCQAIQIYEELFEAQEINRCDLNNAYETLCITYIANNKEGHAYEVLHKITDASIVNSLRIKLQQVYAQRKVVCI